ALCVRCGVRKIRVTGGEPLVRRGLPELVSRLRALPGIETVGMTTNGMLLARYAEELCSEGLDAVNVSLDTLREDRFLRITRRRGVAEVLRGIEAALQSGIPRIKVNTVVIRGVNDDEVMDFVDFVRLRPLQLRFIEYMPFASNAWSADALLPSAELRARIAAQLPLEAAVEEDGNAVAECYHVAGHRGSIGFISSMSDHFCQRCNRIRLTADGAFKSCLFSEGEVDMRALLRGGADDARIVAALREGLEMKWEAHPAARELPLLDNRSMIRIGG
ncbi:MAG: GTP 3',8-cyclase MoaA, partial [Bacteroidota bacterium]|nr:GTP 3',8-cyclase MoaA [Bacteroidota bacterium]